MIPYTLIPQTNDPVSDLSWFIEGVAYSISGDNSRRQGFEQKLREFLELRQIEVVEKKNENEN